MRMMCCVTEIQCMFDHKASESWIRTQGSKQSFDPRLRQCSGRGEGDFEALIIDQSQKGGLFFYVTGLRCTPISAETLGLQHPFSTNPCITHAHTHTTTPYQTPNLCY